MKTEPPAKSEKWYSFFYTFFKFSTDAQLIKLFFAPIYLWQWQQARPEPHAMSCEAWLELYGNAAKGYRFQDEQPDRESEPEKRLLQRIRALGDHLTETASQRIGEDLNGYLGKNRNVCNFPERFLSAFIPATVSDLRGALADYYVIIIGSLFQGHEDLQPAYLERLRMLNNDTDWFHVPTITTSSTDIAYAQQDEIAYYLSSFSILSAAYHIDQNPKPSGWSNVPADVFYQTQILLEVPTSYVPSAKAPSAMIEISLQRFAELTIAAAQSCQLEMLQMILDICKDIPALRTLSRQDQRSIGNMITALKEAQKNLICNLGLYTPSDVNSMFRIGARIADIEEFWNKQMKNQ